MSRSVKRAGISLAAVAVLVAGAAACQSGDAKKAGDAPKKAAGQSSSNAARTALQAAYKKTSAAKSAKVTMKMSMPSAAGAGAGDMEMSGVQSWNPAAMDFTTSAAALKGRPGAPDKFRTVMVDNVMYMDLGPEAAQGHDGKRWMKMDLGALAKDAGGDAMAQQLTGGAQNQDPAQQLALLTDSPNVKHLGSEQVDGAPAEHYKGTLTLEEMVAGNQGLDGLSAQERQKLIDGMKTAGIKGYDTELWLNKAGYPVQMNVGVDTPQGKIAMSAHYSDYGTKNTVQAPSAGDTYDFADMLKGLDKKGLDMGDAA
uniref:Lipoprotein n=1 Tax=Streptomyces sp. NBC_00003 TaxID=2903608 RepID=A0AAU2V4M9_9ACTN